MNAIVMMTSGVAWFAAAAVLALLLAFHKTLSGGRGCPDRRAIRRHPHPADSPRR